jgi:hypothetical protein
MDQIYEQVSATIARPPFVLPLGLTRGVSNDAYHEDTSAVSSTRLKPILTSPAHFKLNIDTWALEESSVEQLFGTVLHAKLLEPDSFEERFFPMPRVDRRTKEGRALADSLDQATCGRTPFPAEWMREIDAMIDSARKHRRIAKILAQGEAEVAFSWIDPATGIKLKAKLDWWSAADLVADVKTCIDASRDGFSKACARYGYSLSAYMYSEGVYQVTGVRPDWVFLALEKSSPYCAAAYQASNGFLRYGKREFEVALRTLLECRERNEYPGLQPDGEWETLDLPPWVRPPGGSSGW